MLSKPPPRRARDEQRLLRHLRLPPAGHRPPLRGHRHREHPLRFRDGRAPCAASTPRPATTSTTPSATSTRLDLSDAEREQVYSGNARRVYPRLDAHPERRRADDDADLHHGRRLARLRPQSVDARASSCPPARSTRTATSSDRATSSRSRPSASTHRATPARTELFALRDHLGVRAQRRSSRPPVTAPTTRAMLDALRRSERPRSRRRDGASPTSRDARARANCTRPACAACASTTCDVSSTPNPTRTTTGSSRRSPRSAGTSSSTSRPPTSRSAGTSSPRSTTVVVVDHMGRPDVTQAGRRTGVRARSCA